MALLEAHRLKMFERDRMLFDVDHLRIYPNDRIGLVGKNGSGKTTLLIRLSLGLKIRRKVMSPSARRFNTCPSSRENTARKVAENGHRNT